MYRIENFRVTDFNFLELEMEEYFITKRNNKYGLFPAKCSHRGGPLFFAKLTEDGKFLIALGIKINLSLAHLAQNLLPVFF